MIERDGVSYSEAVDPLDSGRLYTETDELIDVGTIEETQQYIDKLEYQMRPLPEEPQ